MSAQAPAWMTAFDGGEWRYYVEGHDPENLYVVDDPRDLDYELLWMRSIPASAADSYGFDLEDEDTVLRNPETGRFEARMIWMECPETASGAVPYMGCRYKRGPRYA